MSATKVDLMKKTALKFCEVYDFQVWDLMEKYCQYLTVYWINKVHTDPLPWSFPQPYSGCAGTLTI